MNWEDGHEWEISKDLYSSSSGLFQVNTNKWP